MKNNDQKSRPGCKRKYIEDVSLKRSPSAPNLAAANRSPLAPNNSVEHRRKTSKSSPKNKNRQHRGSVNRRIVAGGCSLLSPRLLQRQALSMDNPFFDYYGCYTPPSPYLSRQHSGHSGRSGSRESMEMELGASAGVSGSQNSMAMDIHLQNECPITVKIWDKNQTKRSDTALRHQLLRQRQVEDGESGESSRRKRNSRLQTQLTVDENVFRSQIRPSTSGARHQSLKIYHLHNPRQDTYRQGLEKNKIRSNVEETKDKKLTEWNRKMNMTIEEQNVSTDKRRRRPDRTTGQSSTESFKRKSSSQRTSRNRRSQSKSPTRSLSKIRSSSVSPTRNRTLEISPPRSPTYRNSSLTLSNPSVVTQVDSKDAILYICSDN